MTFYLGTHEPAWLKRSPVSLFISAVRLRGARAKRRNGKPRALVPWALDSGGFSELSTRGHWSVGGAQYAEEVRRWRDAIGKLEWAAIQDWMCEPTIMKLTGLTIGDHQRRTIASLIELRDLAPDVPWVPVVQGWRLDDYHEHVDAYARAGVDLRNEPRVGVGSVCRRQGTKEAEDIFRGLHSRGLRLHAFGIKTLGLRRFANALVSADSMAWSYAARKRQVMDDCAHITCSNCYRWAQRWHGEITAEHPGL